MVVVYSSWFMSKSIDSWDNSVSVLFNLLLFSITILCNFIFCYFLFIIPVAKENTRLKLAIAIPTETPITAVKRNNGYSCTCCR